MNKKNLLEESRLRMQQEETPETRLEHAKIIVNCIKSARNNAPSTDSVLLDELRQLFSQTNEFALQEQLAKALFYSHLNMCARKEWSKTESLRSELLDLSKSDGMILRQFAKATYNEHLAARKLENLEKSNSIFAELEKICTNSNDSVLHELFAKTLVNAHCDALESKDIEKERQLLENLKVLCSTYNEPALREMLAKVFANEHLTAVKSKDTVKANKALAQLRELRAEHDEPSLREPYARALINAHINAGDLKDWDKADAILSELRDLSSTNDEPILRERLSHALVNAHIDAGNSNDWNKAEKLLNELRHLASTYNQSALRERLANSLVNAHIDAGNSKKWKEAEDLLEELRKFTKKNREVELCECLAHALSNAYDYAVQIKDFDKANVLLNELRTLTRKINRETPRERLANVLVQAHKEALDSKQWDEANALIKEIKKISNKYGEEPLYAALAAALVSIHNQATGSLANTQNYKAIEDLCSVSKAHSDSALKTILDELDIKQLAVAEVALEELRALNSKFSCVQISEHLSAALSNHHFSILKKNQLQAEKMLNELELLNDTHKNGIILKNYYEALDIASEHWSEICPGKSQELYIKATTIFNKLTNDDIALLSPRDRCKYRILSVIKGFSHCQESFIQKMDQREERTKNFLLPESHFRGEKSLLFILRQWNSYTPILVEDQEYDRGGGYFIYHCNSEQQKIGLVIDPGYNFIENFHRACCRIHDITHIAITHAHDDHTAQLEQLFTLLYQYNSKNNNQDSPRKQITLLLNHSVLKKFSGFDMYKESPYIKEVITLNAFDEENHQRIALSKDFFLTVLPAYHNDIYSRHYAVGFGIEIGEMNNFKKIIFTGDTGLFPPLDRSAESKNNRYSGKYKDTLKVDEREGKEVYLHYPNTFKKNPDLLIPHIGSIQKYEFKPRSTVDIPMFYPNHLGLLGTALLINHIWPKAVILSEFGAELRDIRAEMTQILQQSLSAATCATKMADSAKKVSVPHEETEYDQNSSCETRTKPFIFPGDPTIVYNIKNGKFLCHGDGSFLPPEYLEFKDVDGGHIGLFQKGKPCATIQPFFKALDNKRHNSSEAVCGISLNYFTD